MKNLDNIFRDARKKWGGNGSGSTYEKTRKLVEELACLIQELDDGAAMQRKFRLLDFGCGDVGWMLPITEIVEYVGIDVVPEVVEMNRLLGVNCHLLTRDTVLPQADLIICRDTLAHLSNVVAVDMLERMKRSGAKWLLASHAVGVRNTDIKDGGFRALNLRGIPFRFPEPDRVISEGQGIKSMGLWEFSQLMPHVAVERLVETPRAPAVTIPLPLPVSVETAPEAFPGV